MSLEQQGVQGSSKSPSNTVVGMSPIQITPMKGIATVRKTVSIGDALEASARTAGGKPVDRSEAAAIMAAEYRVTVSNLVCTGELAVAAQFAVAFNDSMIGDQGKVKLGDILTGARAKLAADKVATFEDANEILDAALMFIPSIAERPSEVAVAVMEAVRMTVNGRYIRVIGMLDEHHHMLS